MALSTAMAISSLLHNNFLPQLLSSTSSLSSSSLSTSISTTKTLRNTSFKIKSLRTEREASSSDPNSGFDPKSGVAVYKPKSYEVLVTDAANSLAYALQDGKSRLEIDFPYVLFSYFNFHK
jgi:hypothetical protein